MDCQWSESADVSGLFRCSKCGFGVPRATIRKSCLGVAGEVTPAWNLIDHDLARMHGNETAQAERFAADIKAAADVAGLELPLGDWTAAGLDSIGLTKARVAEWMGGDCGGCGRRQEWLNKLGGKLAAFFTAPAPPER